MNWFLNMKIGKKLIMAFLFVAVLAGMVGMIGIVSLYNLAQEDTALYEFYTLPLEQMGNITEAYQRGRVNFRDMMASTAPGV